MEERGNGFLDRAFGADPDARKPPAPDPPEIGPFKRSFWKSPLRGPWLTSFTGSALLVAIVVCAVTGFLSHVAYETTLGENSVVLGDGPLTFLYEWLSWPAGWAYLYAVTQGMHVIFGVAAIPLLLLKLWSVIPKFFERPALRSLAHMLERTSLALFIGSALFLFATGLLNIQVWYPFGFSFVPAHYYASFVFVGALTLHLALKLPLVARSFREHGVVKPLGRNQTIHEDAEAHESVALAPDSATISRRGLVGAVAATSLGLAVMMAGQSIGGPLRRIALLAPRGQEYGTGPNAFQINKTARLAGIASADTGETWILKVAGSDQLELSRADLLALPQVTERLPIACVEGWSTTQDWTGIPLIALGRMVGGDSAETLLVQSLQESGSFSEVVLNRAQLSDSRSLLALKVNGADLSLDHGFPARIIIPGAPGVHNTKWVDRLTFGAV